MDNAKYIVDCIKRFFTEYITISELEPSMYKDYTRLLFQLNSHEISDKTNISERHDAIRRAGGKIFMLYLNSCAVACGKVWIEPKISDSVGHIEDIVVDEEYRNQGIGTFLVEYLKDYALKHHYCYKVLLNAKKSLINFYTNNGFRNEGVQMSFRPKMYEAVFLVASMLIPNRYQSFTPDERFAQILETIDNIRKRVPNSYAILIEGSNIPIEMSNELTKRFDTALFMGNDTSIHPYVNHPSNIGHGEHKLLEKGLDFLETKSNIKAPFIIKMGARYSLSEKFCLHHHDKNKYNFRATWDESLKQNVYITGLYSIPWSKRYDFKKLLQESQTRLSYDMAMVEQVFAELLDSNDVNLLDVIGFTGQLSYNKFCLDQ